MLWIFDKGDLSLAIVARDSTGISRRRPLLLFMVDMLIVMRKEILYDICALELRGSSLPRV
jgi:hypothetical protein